MNIYGKHGVTEYNVDAKVNEKMTTWKGIVTSGQNGDGSKDSELLVFDKFQFKIRE